MAHCTRVGFSLFAISVATAGCVSGIAYRGDGRFTDRGPTAAVERYVLDLGAVDAATKGQHRYSIAGLPSVEMAIGLEVTSASGERIRETRPINALVEVIVVNSRNEIVIHQREELAHWTWSTKSSDESRAFVYRGGDVTERSPGSGAQRFERVGVRADGGWGTFFTPKSNENYTLTFSILQPASMGQTYGIKLQLKGGGWKA